MKAKLLKRFLIPSTILALILIIGSLLISPATLAAPPDGKGFDKPVKVKSEEWVSKFAKTREVSRTSTQITYETEVSLLPFLTDDGQVIDPAFHRKTNKDGVGYWQSGINIYNVRVAKSGRVAIVDSAGRTSVWQPILSVGKVREAGKPILLHNDPFNENYHDNVIEWKYQWKSGFFGTSREVIRYVRIIEGMVMEYWIINNNPGGDLYIYQHKDSELGALAELGTATAFDSKLGAPQYLEVENILGGIQIKAGEFKNKIYPVTIDPTSAFTTSSYDGYLASGFDVSWTAARDLAQPADGWTYSSASAGHLVISSMNWDSLYNIERSYLYFDTSSIQDDATITSAYIALRSQAVHDALGSFDIIVSNGMPTYPHSPLALGDYNRVNYLGNGGSISTSSIGSGYNNINLGSTGYSWISKTGITKFILRTSYDYNNVVPPDSGSLGGSDLGQKWQVSSYEMGTGYAPKLYVTYTLPIVTPAITTQPAYNIDETSMWLKGYLSNDGGEACTVRFEYGTSTSYGSYTSWQSGFTSGTYSYVQIAGLARGTTYYFRAVATNSAGSGYGSALSASTLPAPPTNFVATGGNQQISLSWSKGNGASTTMIRFKTTGYPSSPSDGTQIYSGTGTSYDHTGLTAGTTYYYSAWSIANSQYSSTYATDYGTPYHIGAPTVETRAATNVEVSAATLNGYLSALNQIGGSVTVSFEYGLTTGYGSNAAAGELNAPSSFSADIAELNTSETYHFRAKAVGANGTGYGDDMTFTTGAISAPTIATTPATGVGLTFGVLNGKVTADGGASVTTWFKWGLSEPSLPNTESSVSGLYTSDTFYFNLAGLAPNTTYYFQAVGQNSAGIGYGSVLNFTTSSPSTPTVETNTATNVGANTATLRGTLTSDGGVPCEVQIEWDEDTGEPYANNGGWQAGITSGSTFENTITELTVGKTYYFRASAKNAAGTVCGTEQTFTTVFAAPTNFIAKTLGANTISLSWTKQSDLTYISYKTTGYPIDRLNGQQVYFGNANSFTHDGLTPGVTYFYTAWSWREGEYWSESYSQDAATTWAVKVGAEETTPPVSGKLPDMPSSFYEQPGYTKLSNMPMYDQINEAADNLGMPRGNFWLLLVMGIGISFAVFVGMLLRNVLFAGITLAAVLLTGWQTGIVPGWIFAIYIVLLVISGWFFSRESA